MENNTLKITLLTTPIGNMADASTRLKEHLTLGELFFVEDTRKFYQLLNLLGIDREGKTVIVFNDHSQTSVPKNIKLIEKFSSAYLVSDAGSPVLSDPAFPMIRAVIEQGGSIESIPGPSAITTAVEVSGLPPIPYMFHGFLPRQQRELISVFKELTPKVTHCFFESPNRIEYTLTQLAKFLPNADVVVVRELTKKFEEHYRFRAERSLEVLETMKKKGEFVLLVRLDEQVTSEIPTASCELANAYMKKPTPKALARLLAEITGEKISDIYGSFDRK